MKKFYEVALLEGEGLGTAYEYYMKRGLLLRLFKKMGIPGTFCIYGIPEKYGSSMDFCLLACHINVSRIMIFDERTEAVNKCCIIIDKMEKNRIIPGSLVHVEERKELSLQDQKYDFITNCDVFQRFSEEKTLKMMEGAVSNSKLSVFFLPNGYNVNYVASPNRKTMDPEEFVGKLENFCEVIEWGYIDMPPFLSGSRMSDQKRSAVKSGLFSALVFIVLRIWSVLERLLPRFLKKKFSHAFYVAVKGK